MARSIQGIYTDPDGTPLVGNVIVTCLESYSNVLKGSTDKFTLVDGEYEFSLEEGKYSFAVELTSVTPITKIYLGNGVITTGTTTLNIATVISASAVVPTSIRPVFNSIDTIVDSVKASQPSFDFSINNVVTTTDDTVDNIELSSTYGGEWVAIGTQVIGTKTLYYFERTSATTTFTMTITDIEVL